MKQLGKYTILEEIGQGGMGAVYRARDAVIGRDVAIKVIHERALNVPEIKERFYREARSAGRLAHENIMVIYDVGEEDGDPYIVMELLRGTTLRQLLRDETSLSLLDRLEIAVQMCEGLYYAHQNGVIHRDIKPDNIQVSDGRRVKILDFGIARLESEARTLTHASIGTPRYMSPEQIKGRAIDHRSDIFSLGVVLYELLTGTNPFHGEHVTTVMYKILNEEPEPIQIADSIVSEDLQSIVSKCLAKNVDQRYAHLGEVIVDLNHAVHLIRDPTLTLPSTSARRGRAAGLPEGHEDAETTGRKREAEAVGAASEPPRRTLKKGPLLAATAVVVVLLAAVFALRRGAMQDDAVVTDSAAVQGSIATALPDLGALRAEVLQEQARMELAKSAADAAEAPTRASALYEAAAEHEQAGMQALGEGDASGLETAHTAFLEAVRLYDEAALQTAGNETEMLRQRADAARTRMLGARRDAQEYRDEPDARTAYAAAERNQDAAQRQFAAEQYEEAVQAFRQAEDGYRTVRNTALARRSDARTVAEAARTEALAAQRTAQPFRTNDVADAFQRADALLGSAGQRFASQAYAEATQTYRSATSLYEQIQREASERANTERANTERANTERANTERTNTEAEADAQADRLRADAEQARDAMVAAKQAVGAGGRERPAYREAVDREAAARQALTASDHAAAATAFLAAAALYEEAGRTQAATAPSYEAYIDEVAQRLRVGFEAEDLAALRSLSSFFDGWGDFFSVAHDIAPDVTVGTVDAGERQATFSVQLRLRYMNNKNERDELSVPLRATIEADGSGWRLARIEAARR